MTKKKLIALLAVLVILLGGIGGYWYYKRSPLYSFKLIQQAVEQKDWDSFQKHVDTKNLLSTSYDALIASSLEADESLDDTSKQFAMQFIMMMKPAIVGSLNSDIEHMIRTGNIETPDSNSSTQEQLQTKMIALNMMNQAGVGRLAIVGVGGVDKSKDLATAAVKVKDEKLDQTFELQVGMKQLEDGTWQVLEITNLKDYLKQMHAAVAKKLEAMNGTLLETMKKEITVAPGKVEIKDANSFGYVKVMHLSAPVNVHSSKVISSINGEFRVTAPGNSMFVVPFNGSVNMDKGTKTLQLSKELNPMVPAQAKWIATDLSTVKVAAIITGIRYQDGSVVELKKDLE